MRREDRPEYTWTKLTLNQKHTLLDLFVGRLALNPAGNPKMGTATRAALMRHGLITGAPAQLTERGRWLAAWEQHRHEQAGQFLDQQEGRQP